MFYVTGECNGSVGDFPTEAVQILPATQKPPAELLKHFKENNAYEEPQPSSVTDTVQQVKLHTLANYANEHFR